MTYQGKTYTLNPNGLCGSYGLNGYLLSIPATGSYEGGVPAKNGYRDMYSVPNANNVPVMLDALRFDLWPSEMSTPADNEFDGLVGQQHGPMLHQSSPGLHELLVPGLVGPQGRPQGALHAAMAPGVQHAGSVDPGRRRERFRLAGLDPAVQGLLIWEAMYCHETDERPQDRLHPH